MRQRVPSSLANPRRSVGAALAIATLVAMPAAPGRADEITIYRCQAADGRVTLQDEACPEGQRETSRSMARPQDPPPRPRPAPAAEAEATPAATDDAAPAAAWSYPPPPMFQCTDYDGDIRFSEDYSPNTRCVPLAVLGYDVRGSSAAAATCRWVQESCLRLDDASACVQFRAKFKQAESDALHAFSDTAAFRESELERLRRIVAESCR